MPSSKVSIDILSYDANKPTKSLNSPLLGPLGSLSACRHRLAFGGKGNDRAFKLSEYIVSPLSERISKIHTTSFGIKSVACGAEHTLVLSEDGRLYSTGSNEHCQLGRSISEGSIDSELAPVACMPVEPIESIACGYFCSFAVTVNGELWAWGDNRYGQLGIPSSHAESVQEPVMVSISPTFNVKQVSSGFAHTWVRSREPNQLASTGNNQHGELGTGDRVSLDGGWNLLQSTVPIESISCGNWVTVLLTSPGDVFQAGVGPSPISEPKLQQDGAEAVSISEHSLTEEDDMDGLPLLSLIGLPPTTTTGSLECVPPRKLDLPDDSDITSVSSGCMCSGASDKSGKVFIWRSDSPDEFRAIAGSAKYREVVALSSSIAALI